MCLASCRVIGTIRPANTDRRERVHHLDLWQKAALQSASDPAPH